MSNMGNSIGAMAVEIVTQGEETNDTKKKVTLNRQKFGQFMGIWLLTWVMLFVALFIVTFAKSKGDVFREAIQSIDMLNMSFSLILSAMLEQIWSKNNVQGFLYEVTKGCEIAFVFVGGMLYIAYSMASENSQLLQKAFEMNLGYTIISAIIVILGFLTRSLDSVV